MSKLEWIEGALPGDAEAESATRIPAGCVTAYYAVNHNVNGKDDWTLTLLGRDVEGVILTDKSVPLGTHATAQEAKDTAQRHEGCEGLSDESQVALSLHSHAADRGVGDDSDEVCLTFPPGLNVHMRRRIGKNGNVEMLVELVTDDLPADIPLVVAVDGREEIRQTG